MNKYTKDILAKMSLTFNSDFDFEKVIIDEINNKISIYITNQDILDIKTYKILYQTISNYLHNDPKISIILSPQQLLDINNLSHIQDYATFLASNNEKLALLLTKIEPSIDDNQLILNLQIQVNNLDIIHKLYYEVLHILGFENSDIKIISPKIAPQEITYQKPSKPVITGCDFGTNVNNDHITSINDALNAMMPEFECCIEGYIYGVEIRDGISKRNRPYTLFTCYVYDGCDGIKCNCFANPKIPREKLLNIKNGMVAKLKGIVKDDRYYDGKIFEINGFEVVLKTSPITKREDLADKKRVELCLHTNLSTLSGVNKLEDYAKLAHHFGHKALAITDKDVVQSFVYGDKISKAYDLKMIYGIEVNAFKKPEIVYNPKNINLADAKYCVFDTETTGLSANFNELIEIGAVMYQNGQIIDSYQQFVKIDHPLTTFIKDLTNITDEDLSQGKDLKTVLTEFANWSKDTILVAHNATFDRQVIARNYERVLGKTLDNPIIDTLELSRFLNSDRTYHSLSKLSRLYKIPIDETAHHRADYDAQQLLLIFEQMLAQLQAKEITNLNQLNEHGNLYLNRGMQNLLYVKDQQGLAPFYELVSDSLTEYFNNNQARMFETDILNKKEHLIYVGGGNINGEIIDGYLNKNLEELEAIINKFDYIQLLAPESYDVLLKNNTFNDQKQIELMLSNLIKLCEKLHKPVIITGDVYFIEPELFVVREMLQSSSYGNYALNKDYSNDNKYLKDKTAFQKWIATNRDTLKHQYYKTTDEMLASFTFLDNKEKYIIDNVNEFVNNIDTIKIIPDKLFTPNIAGVDQKVETMVYQKAYELYGDPLPELIQNRILKELKAIIDYGYAVIYYISYKLVKYSNENGYLVGSRGSVGSSIVAFLMGISEVNPLPPHYYCSYCHQFILADSTIYGSGYDLPDKNCSICHKPMNHDGQDIPFETFLGFKGDKVPDIDLNFSGDFQAKAHDFVRSKEVLGDDELFDENHAFRAGTIKTLAAKTAYNATLSYARLLEEKITDPISKYYALYCEGSKQSTGQHPGGIIVIPQDLSVYDFTPIQFPANKRDSPWRTTHFDFNAIHDNVLKLDILGHDDPTMLKKLYTLTGIDPTTINVADEKVLELFLSNKSLEFKTPINQDLGSLGLPEFGTEIVMKLLRKAKPKTFADLVQVSGLSHGTGVWSGNAEELIDQKICNISEVIGCRDDIMVYLIKHNLPSKDAFSIMENVRKGRGLTKEEESLMQHHNVPQWYIDSCKKIEYMFPKAHACAYVLMALRIGWYKVYEPLAYYSAYFSSRIKKFDIYAMIGGLDKINAKLEQLQIDLTKPIKERMESVSNEIIEEKIKCLSMAREMCARGYYFQSVSLQQSQPYQFVINDTHDGLILPFQAVENLGEKEAQSIVEQREAKPFVDYEDFKTRCSVKEPSCKALEVLNVFDYLKQKGE